MAMDKSQGSMEYMLQYGWAVLVLVIVLALLYALVGPQGAGQLLGSQGCVPDIGYICTNPVLNTSGYLGITLSLNGGAYKVTGLGCSTTNSSSIKTRSVNISVTGGTPFGAVFKCPIAPRGSSAVPIGSQFSGYLWITYNTPTETNVTSQIGRVSTSVSTSSSFPSVAHLPFVSAGSFGVTSGNSGTLTATINLPADYPLYICGGGIFGSSPSPGLASYTWTLDTGYGSGASTSRQSANSCTDTSTPASPSSGIVVGGVAVAKQPYNVFDNSGSLTMSYSVTQPNTYTVIVVVGGGGFILSGVNLLPGCSLTLNNPGNPGIIIETCPSQSAGPYTVTVMSGGGVGDTIAAYLFSP